MKRQNQRTRIRIPSNQKNKHGLCSSWNLKLDIELPRINRVREVRMRNAIGESAKIGSQKGQKLI